MNSIIKYQFAKDTSGQKVDIKTIEKDTSHNVKYYCYGCGEELIPKVGNIRTHHFSHKNNEHNCSKETYLHELGKIIFQDTYIQCLSNNEPFYIETLMSGVCKYNQIITAKNCVKKEIKVFDLKDRFKNIELEKFKDNFKPDLTLIDSNNEIIFIEIVVTHFSSDEKINSGNKVIEIIIKNESDINIITSKYLSYKNENIKIYNFETFEINVDPICNDNNVYNYLFTLRNGQQIPVSNKKNEICKIIYDNKNIIHNIQPIVFKPMFNFNNLHTNQRGPRIDDIDKHLNSNRKFTHNYKKRKK